MDIKVNDRTVIVFDLDDTLYNEMDYLISAYKEIAKNLNSTDWQRLFAQMYSLFRSKQDVFEFITSKYDITKSELLRQYRGHIPAINLFENVLETIQQIKQKDGKIAIITDGRVSTQTEKLKALGILPYIDKIVISEAIGSEKPDERNFKIIEDTFKNHQYLYMADNLRKDFISPNKLGWMSLGLIDRGLNMHFDGYQYFDEEHAPKNFVFSFNDINII